MRLTAPWDPVEVERSFTAPPDRVFEMLCDPGTYPQWLVGAQEVRRVDRDFPTPGAAFEHSVGPTDATTLDDRSEVVDADETSDRKELVLLVHAGFFHGLVQFVVRPHGDGGAHVHFREIPVGFLRWLTPALHVPLKLRNARSLQQLSALLDEGGQPDRRSSARASAGADR